MFRQLLSPSILIAFFITALLTGCTAARMQLPSDISAGASEMPVEGRKAFSFDESFSFGTYNILEVKRGWKETTAWGIFGFDSSHARQTYEFKIRSYDHQLMANCATDVDWKSMQSDNFLDTGGTMNWELSSALVFACTFTEEKSGNTWKLIMNQNTQNMVMDGVFTDNKLAILVKGTQKLSGSSLPLLDPTGYYFRKDEKSIGAVEVINNGAVWIDSSQPKAVQAALAGASGALMLYQDLKD